MTSNQNEVAKQQKQEEAAEATKKTFKQTKQGKHVDRYCILETFGDTGICSTIYSCIVDDENDPEHGTKLLVKKYRKDRIKSERMQERIKEELLLQRQLSSPANNFGRSCYLQVYGITAVQTINNMYCFGPFLEKKNDLYDVITKQTTEKRLKERVARRFFRQMVIALRFCHAKGIAHQDIKLENFLHDSTTNSLLLTDFGLARAATKSTRNTDMSRIAEYAAPELLQMYSNSLMSTSEQQEQQQKEQLEEENEKESKKEEQEKKYGFSPFLSDCYSLGVVLFSIVAGRFPFAASTKKQQLDNITSLKYKMSEQFSEQLSDLISHLMCFEKDRYSTRDIILHPWFLSEDTEGEEGAFDFKRLLVASGTFTLWPTFRPLFQVAYKCRDSKSKLSSCLSSIYNIRHYCALFLPIIASKESLKEIDKSEKIILYKKL